MHDRTNSDSWAVTRRAVLLGGLALTAAGCTGSGKHASESSSATAPGGNLRVLENRYPRAWFFRQVESVKGSDQASWSAAFGVLGGVEAKVVPDDTPGANVDDLKARIAALKHDHPEQLALMHANGKGRRPTDDADLRFSSFSAGHWLYYAGTQLSDDLAPHETAIKVADGGRFKMGRMTKDSQGAPDDTDDGAQAGANGNKGGADNNNDGDNGRTRNSSQGDDIVIVPRIGGRLDWSKAEHATVTSIDGNTLHVERGQFGTTARHVKAGARVAAHVRFQPPALADAGTGQGAGNGNGQGNGEGQGHANGPRKNNGQNDNGKNKHGQNKHGQNNNGQDNNGQSQSSPTDGPSGDSGPSAVWLYNYSTACPKDANGKTCADVLVAEYVDRFAKAEQDFDGVEFDVMHSWCTGGDSYRFADDADQIDVDNDDKPDQGFRGNENLYGAGVAAFLAALRKALPDKLLLADGYMEQIYQRNMLSLNGMESEGFPEHNDPELDGWSHGLNTHAYWNSVPRSGPSLSYIVYKYSGADGSKPPGEDNLDAFRRVRLSIAASVFVGSGYVPGGTALPKSMQGTGAHLKTAVLDELWAGADKRPQWLGRPKAAAVHLAAKGKSLVGSPASLSSRIKGSSVAGSDLKLQGGSTGRTSPDTRETIYASTLTGLRSNATSLYVELTASGEALKSLPEAGRHLWVSAHAPGKDGERIHAFVGPHATSSTFQFRSVPSGDLELTFEVEGQAPIRISKLLVTAEPDAMYRDFEGGIVLANPGDHPYRFDLDAITDSGRKLRRLRGTQGQDQKVNSGAAVSDRQIEIGPRDALFLIDDH